MLSVRNIVQITAQNEIILVAEVNQIIKSVTACHPEIPERVEQAQASPTLRHSLSKKSLSLLRNRDSLFFALENTFAVVNPYDTDKGPCIQNRDHIYEPAYDRNALRVHGAGQKMHN